MKHLTNHQPVSIPSGIVQHAGNEFMPDTRGALVPIESIKPQHKLEDETVRKVIGFAMGLSEQVERFKAHTMSDLAALDSVLEQEYQFVKQGNKGKGNRTYMTIDGLFKVTVQIADYIDFGPELQIAKGLIDECLIEWVATGNPEIRTIITNHFNTDKEGKINRAEVFKLFRYDFDDPRWLQAMKAIRDAMRVVSSKEYVRFGMRPNVNNAWQAVTINLAKA